MVCLFHTCFRLLFYYCNEISEAGYFIKKSCLLTSLAVLEIESKALQGKCSVSELTPQSISYF